MSLHSRSAEDVREQWLARKNLERLDRRRELIEGYRQAKTAEVRADFAHRYRRIFGVDPERHDELHAALQRVVAGGRMAVADVLAAMQ